MKGSKEMGLVMEALGAVRELSHEELVAAITRDVVAIAKDAWFETPIATTDDVAAEVQRRLDGMEQTRQYVAKIQAWRDQRASENTEG